jgi:hypothetical protein
VKCVIRALNGVSSSVLINLIFKNLCKILLELCVGNSVSDDEKTPRCPLELTDLQTRRKEPYVSFRLQKFIETNTTLRKTYQFPATKINQTSAVTG